MFSETRGLFHKPVNLYSHISPNLNQIVLEAALTNSLDLSSLKFQLANPLTLTSSRKTRAFHEIFFSPLSSLTSLMIRVEHGGCDAVDETEGLVWHGFGGGGREIPRDEVLSCD